MIDSVMIDALPIQSSAGAAGLAGHPASNCNQCRAFGEPDQSYPNKNKEARKGVLLLGNNTSQTAR